jgi:hypothetical protein
MGTLNREQVGKTLRAHWRALTLIVALLLAWTLAGFLWVPRLARTAITNYVQRDLGRQVTLGDIAFNPYTLTVEIHDFALAEADDTPIASFSLLRVNAQSISSLLHRAWTLKELRIEQPLVAVRLDESGSLNLARLVPPKKPDAPAAKPAAMPAIRIGRLAIVDGSVDYDDRTRATPFHATLRPIEFSLDDFRTAPAHETAYHFDAVTLAGEKLAWSGAFSVQPLGSSGEFNVIGLRAKTIAAYLHDVLPFALPSGQVDLGGSYRLALDGALSLDLTLPQIALRDMAIAPGGEAGAAPWITLPAVAISGTTLALPQRRIHVEEIGISGAGVTAWREEDGGLNLARLAPTAAAPPVAGTPVTAPASDPWELSVARVDLKNATLDFEDRSIKPAGRLKLTPVEANLGGYTLAAGAPLTLEASVGFDGHGRVTTKGTLTPSPLAADLELEVADFALAPLQPWVASVTALRIETGSLGANARLRLRPAPKRGESKLLTRDATWKQELIRWQQLDMQGIDFRQAPDRLDIDTIRARKPYGRVVIGSDRSLNIARVLAGPVGTVLSPPPAEESGDAQPSAKNAQPAVSPAAPRMPMRIRRVLIEDGTADFADFSVQPNFAAAILGLNGDITGLSSDPASRARVALKGSVDRHAPVEISGEVNLLAATVYTDIALGFHNMELTTFNPYSGKFAGYDIAKGKLSTDLKYHIENRQLDAQHHIVLDQLEFGTATGSKDAVPLPVKLAVALLKDRSGVIDIDLPVSGSLDDPKFRIGPIVWKAFIGLLRKIVTSPFALLGSLVGGGADLAQVEFAAGSAVLVPQEQDKLGKLAKALYDRPQLKLDIPLETLSPADDAALGQAAFEAAVTAAGPVAAAKGKPPRLAALEALYTQAFGAKPVYPSTSGVAGADAGTDAARADVAGAQIAWLEAQLAPKYVATPRQRAALGRSRADAVQSAILADGQVAAERVFLTERQSGQGGATDGARMELKLE